jgi:hypothetical protein
MDRLSKQCGILIMPRPYTPPRPVTGIALLTYLLSVAFVNQSGMVVDCEVYERKQPWPIIKQYDSK